MHFVARECFWRVESFDWRIVHRTYHKCFLSKDNFRFIALIGADAPFLALAQERDDGRWAFFDNASAGSAVKGYDAQSVELLSAQDLNTDLSSLDRAWLEALGEHMRYDLRYWNPGTVGQVVFNFWD
ncbi:MAG TPA: hypothetical protein VM915_11620 [Verrucomicrobiae bacterium]|jgi:hypothetical protein|nr:hypothetical protein [Verrucomicrobiae bacterium]